ncbi:LOW QUALITY PROTEIN: CUB and sushi domain-containing protein 3-like [Plectropomus leopardus]|uniref:LOW QUALITY PROTEIN: CUB and sushi domain-containing protein 3-like n=1 Tax=Plectropomus leopardus TaxID=160734 RepID=UPI001C4CF244|nr:LOW QUALITY PROTEIN: CUB and sushi domain-containing protein 3-like [Plectropomus leopardus]
MRSFLWNILILSFALLAAARAPKKCSAPPRYAHTRLVKKFSTMRRFISRDKVYYDCAKDFSPSRGSRAVQCVAGKWTKLTLKCEKKTCGNAGDLLHGEFHYEGNTFLGEKVYAVCNEGYTLKGLNYNICKSSGWTGEFPSCVEGEATCSTPAVASSVSSAGDVSVHQVGDNVTFTCRQGFQLDGAPQITCGPGGQWHPRPPRCLASPVTTQSPATSQAPDKATGGCGVPVTLLNSNANLANKYITKTSFASGDRVHYVCDVGYIQAGGSRYRSCINGEWSPLRLKCERKLCGSAGEIINGQFTYTGVEFGDTARAICDDGHRLVGRATRTCMSQGWNGHVPTCEAVVCEEPSKATNAVMKGPQEPPYTYRTVIRYHCHVGTLTGQSQIWCTEDGTWSDSPPTCKEITCPFPNVSNAYWMGAQTKMYRERDTIYIECTPGYTRTGPSIATCGPDGQWFPGLPKCTYQ